MFTDACHSRSRAGMVRICTTPTAIAISIFSAASRSPASVTEIRASCARSRSRPKSSLTSPTSFTPSRLRDWSSGWRIISATEKSFSANSGAEANEAAIKLARRWGSNAGGGRFEILTTLGSFHGRTLATVSATGQERYHQGFQPLMPGFQICAVRRSRGARPCAARRNRRRDGRADPGRGRRGRAARGLPEAAARLVRSQQAAADTRRSTNRNGPHREILRVRARRHQARHRDAGQGARRRAPDRRDDRASRDSVELHARQPWQHLRRQSGGVRGGGRGDRRARAGRRAGERVERRRATSSSGSAHLQSPAIESSRFADSG